MQFYLLSVRLSAATIAGFFSLSNFCFCLVFGYGLKRHNHSKPQIKRNSKRKRHEGEKKTNKIVVVVMHMRGGWISQ